MPVSAEPWILEYPAVLFDGTTSTTPLEYHPLPRAERDWHLCILYPHLKDDYWLSVNFGMVEEAHRLGVSFSLNEAGGYPNDVRQNTQLRNCIQSGADAIVLGTVTYSGHLDTILQAASLMPVIAVVNDIDPRGIAAKSAVSWVEMGAEAGRYLAERHPMGTPEVTVAWFPGPHGAGWVEFIERGFHAAIADTAVTIVGKFHGDTGREEQILLVEQALSEHASLDYLVGSGPMAEVAVSILRAQGLSEQVGIISTYMSHGVFRGVHRGRILAAPTDFAVLQGRLGIEMAVRAIEGKLKISEAGPAIATVTLQTVDEIGSANSLAPAAFNPIFAFPQEKR